MTAKEMFEKLGYKLIKQKKQWEHLIVYEKYNKRFDKTSTITFNTISKLFMKELDDNVCGIFINELQAINKQVEELGWNK